jgi:hypothetical protein
MQYFPVNWSQFSWEAFATLLTGLAAVIAAWHIGRKQTAIQSQALRSDLFTKRLENYETVRDFMNSVLRTPGDIDPNLQNKFFTAQREARFLFSDHVWQGLDRIHELHSELHGLSCEMRQEIATQGHAGVSLPQLRHAAYKAYSHEYRNLHLLYSEMKLSGF